ncbi:ATP--guanido phosphotransferase [Peptoniphilus equinus]|uniref:ATP--guanido phosphotransferase n=1 Tax=Peptoniphilus equinus TaxID=3016343 RepID=A0ABY7QRR1_9FIRM|nr:ATP--guanido phosphotransferase [Peptoniphilus equinus]WBW49473.1 ATP--guanido phosphotransferase [Peptoniphilus equinus]
MVLNTELRLRRNIHGYPFVGKLSPEEGSKLLADVKSVLEPIGYSFKATHAMSSLEKLAIFETYDGDSDLFTHGDLSGVFTMDKAPTVLFLGSDHIELVMTDTRLHFMALFDALNHLDDYFAERLHVAFSKTFGYLTTQPQNCGNGMVASVTLHLPGTAFYKMDSLKSSLHRLGYTVAMLRSDHGQVHSVLRISPERNLGVSEKDMLGKLENIVAEILSMEESNEKALSLEHPMELEDRTYRAYGLLRYGRYLTEAEMINGFSDLTLGMKLSVIQTQQPVDLMGRIPEFRNGHLQVAQHTLLDGKSRDLIRAREIRKMMKEVFL